MLDVGNSIIILNIERAHRACLPPPSIPTPPPPPSPAISTPKTRKETNQYSALGLLPIIAKFTDWNLMEQVRSN